MLQCSLEAITGRHRFLQALHPGALLAVCATESDGAPKAALVCAVWLCSAAAEARLGAASRALGRPVRAWHDLPQLLRLALAGSTRAERALAGVGLALAAAGLVLGGPDAMLRWLANLLLALWGGSVGMRIAAASLLQARLVHVLLCIAACADWLPASAAVARYARQKRDSCGRLPRIAGDIDAVGALPAAPLHVTSSPVCSHRRAVPLQVLCSTRRAARRYAHRRPRRRGPVDAVVSVSQQAEFRLAKSRRAVWLPPARANRTPGPLSPDGFEARPQGHSGSVRRPWLHAARLCAAIVFRPMWLMGLQASMGAAQSWRWARLQREEQARTKDTDAGTRTKRARRVREPFAAYNGEPPTHCLNGTKQ